MKKNLLKGFSIKQNSSRIISVFACSILLVAIYILMSYAQKLLYYDVKINLMEVVTQNKDVITSKLQLEVNNIELFAHQIENEMQEYDQVGEQELKTAMEKVGTFTDNKRFFVATAEGRAFFYDGAEINIAERQYFRLAMEGIQNVSGKIVSRLDGTDVFTISVPLYRGEAVVGTVQKSYTTQEMYNLCAISLFSSKGYMSIINSEGNLIVSTKNKTYNQELDNYFSTAYSQSNKSEILKLQEDIKNERSGFMEMTEDNKKVFSAYTPIEDIHDWYLITSIEQNAVSPNASLVVKMFYMVLVVIVTAFGLGMFYFFRFKKKQQSRLEHIAFFDTVTFGDTYNKFEVDVGEMIAQNPETTFYIMAFDIDNFKYVNSYYGFDVGDKILRGINRSISSKLTEDERIARVSGDHFVDVNSYYGFDVGDKILRGINRSISSKLTEDERIARVSGDHFVVFLKDAGEARLRDILKMHQTEEGVTVYFSAGLYEIKDRGESVNLMVDKATTAAQDAKGFLNANKQVQIYSKRFEEQMVTNEQMKRAVEQALEKDEIVPFYQPKVDVNTGRLMGAEALARWVKKDGSLISPDQFIPISEKTGLILELDLSIFEKTLQFIRRNLDAGIGCTPISVNFSRFHLHDKDFFDEMLNKIKKYEIPFDLVELELTESAIFENSEMILEFTNRLHEYGISLSMDDFGSGYSSLNMLNDIPIDVLKIDRAFLKETGNSERQRIILGSIADMAIRLNIKVVVEGVETLENVNLMKDLGFEVAQGYYFARPMNETSFEQIYRRGMI